MATVSIRFWESGDEKALFEAARESIAELYPWLPWCHPDYALDDSLRWIEWSRKARERGDEFSFAIADRDGRLLGGCGLNAIHPAHRFANLGYWVRSSAMGRGVAPTAVRLLADWAFRNTDLVRLEILASVHNQRSLRVAVKAGAVREGILSSRLRVHGELHDAAVHSIVRSQWRGG
jgi:RimJ/RimL family protein N-acetyltransferase